ncbi:MAG TPA: GAF domain-containing protein [Gammaproteobacteria bacterium]|nr:GAF domain-containing protein [Gammaproteobacteria bacterium]
MPGTEQIKMQATGKPAHSGKYGRLMPWLRPHAAGWRKKSPALVSSGLFMPLVTLLSILVLLGLNSYIMVTTKDNMDWLYSVQIALLLGGAIAIGLMLYRINHQLMLPLAHMRSWAMRMRGGNLSARIPVPGHGEFAELVKDINGLGKDLETLSRRMDDQVKKQTEQIEQKTRSLEILYDVAASINTSRSLEDLLHRFLNTLMGVVNARAATVRLITDDNQMRLVSSIGLDEKIIKEEQLIPVDRCMCGKAFQNGDVLTQDNISQCGEFAGQPFFDQDDIEMIAVPLQHAGKNLGVYNLFVEQRSLLEREDIKEILTSIGRHLGIAIETSRLDETAKRQEINQERTMLSHELHDSLAQTLASLRFQARNLEDSLLHADNDTARHEVSNIQNGLDEAYTELRELLSHFRAPFDERGLISAIDNVIDRFRKETNILIFFQNQWNELCMPSTLEMQVLRIVQESLTNIRKHSKAHAVRVLLRMDENNDYSILIEDDGIGLKNRVLDGKAGEHIGLSIMQERAKRLHGNLSFESEPGEGTRVMLTFKPAPEKDQSTFTNI